MRENPTTGVNASVADEHYLRHGERVGMGDREERPPDLHALSAAGGLAAQLQPRRSATANYFDILPEHAARVARAARLHGGFLGGETAGQVRRGVAPLRTIGNLSCGKHAVQEAIAVPFEHVG